MKKVLCVAVLALSLLTFPELHAQSRKSSTSKGNHKKETREETVRRWRAQDESVKRQIQRDKEHQRKYPNKGLSSSSSSSGKSSKRSSGPVQVRRE